MYNTFKNKTIVDPENKNMLWEILNEKAKDDLNYNIEMNRDIQLYFNSILYQIHDDRYSYPKGLQQMNKTLISECYKFILNFHSKYIQSQRNKVIENQKFPQNSRMPNKYKINQETSSTINNNAPMSIGTRKTNQLKLSQKRYENFLNEREDLMGKPKEIDFSISINDELPNVDILMEENIKKRDHELEMITRGYATPPNKKANNINLKNEENVKIMNKTPIKKYDSHGNVLLNIDHSKTINISNETKPLKSILTKSQDFNDNKKMVKSTLKEEEEKEKDSINISGLMNKLKTKLKPMEEDKAEKNIELLNKNYNHIKEKVNNIENNIREIYDILKELKESKN